MPKKIVADKQYFLDRKIAYCVLRATIKKIKDIEGKETSQNIYIFRVINKEEYQKIKDEGWDHILKIEHENTRKNDHLQALDVLSGAIYNFYEHKDSSLLDILKNGKIKINIEEIK